jgi:60 kDa SS-A/Ro ribonucleoprotein
MGKYNTAQKKAPNTVTNHQGGTGYKQSDEIALISLLATGIQGRYYEMEKDREARLESLIASLSKKDPLLVAKMIIYARTTMGQRSVTHLAAVYFAKYVGGKEFAKKFFSKRSRSKNEGGVIFRIDDMLEIAACYFTKNEGKALSNAIKRGFRDAIENSDSYELAKYKGEGRGVSLIDLVNLVHPSETTKNGSVWVNAAAYEKAVKGTKFGKNTEANAKVMETKNGEVLIPALHALVLGLLKQTNTVEDKNTDAGQKVAAKVKAGTITKEEAEDELRDAKSENYAELIKTKKIGYLALLRNLRNIISTDTKLVDPACELLTDESFVRRSMVFPHQIDLAADVIQNETSGADSRKVVTALNKAYELSIPNLADMNLMGNTAVVFDTSGSMHSGGMAVNGKGRTYAPIEKAALIGATLGKGMNADVFQFASYTQELKFNPGDTVFSIKNGFMSHNGEVGHGTAFDSIFETFNKMGKIYERIFIISDLQGGDECLKGSQYAKYCSRAGNPYLYTIDLQGYGSNMFKENNRLFQLAGYSAAIYETAKKYEIDPQALLNEVKAINI